jgi:hypothetical protein
MRIWKDMHKSTIERHGGSHIIVLLWWFWFIAVSSEVCISCHIGTLMTKNMNTGKCEILGFHSGVDNCVCARARVYSF